MKASPAALLLVVALAGCDLFAPRAPERPSEAGGTFVQPDTPELVVENVQAAVAELSVPNYTRSLGEPFAFEPTASAAAQSPVWAGWGLDEEAQYFSTLVAAAQFGSGHRLELSDETLVLLGDTEARYDAAYLLRVDHRRPGVPTAVAGRLAWTLRQDGDGLWRLVGWADFQNGDVPAWSDLKLAFLN